MAGAAGLCHEMGPEQLTALIHSGRKGAAAAYVARHFAHFDFTGITVMGPTRTLHGREDVKVGTVLMQLIDLGAGHSPGNVAVHVPDEDVVFAGDALFSGVHMVVVRVVERLHPGVPDAVGHGRGRVRAGPRAAVGPQRRCRDP